MFSASHFEHIGSYGRPSHRDEHYFLMHVYLNSPMIPFVYMKLVFLISNLALHRHLRKVIARCMHVSLDITYRSYIIGVHVMLLPSRDINVRSVRQRLITSTAQYVARARLSQFDPL
jgi:hypothetical protein